MISAKDARLVLLKNPTFERKVELYNEVSDIIDKALVDGKKQFEINDEQHHALNKELLDKGYTVSQWSVFFLNNQHVYVI